MRPLSNKGVSGELRYLGSPSPNIRPPKAITRPRGIADRDHQAAAEAVIRLLVIDRDQQARLDQHVVAKCLSAVQIAVRLSGAKPKPNAFIVSALKARAFRQIFPRVRAIQILFNCATNQSCAAAMTS